jgi:iron(III) transport system substrate-binding protein
MAVSGYWERFWRREISRRRLIGGAAIGGAGLLTSIACGGGGAKQSSSSGPQSSATVASTSATSAVDQKLYAAAKQEGRVAWWATINSGNDLDAYKKAFSEKYPGINVDYYEASEDVVAQRVIQEHQAGKNNVDVFVGTAYNPLKQAGVLADLSGLVEPPVWPADLFNPPKDDAYYAYTVTTWAYNTNNVKASEAPKNYQDLLASRWKGKIALEAKMDVFVFGTDLPAYQGKVQGMRPEAQWVDYLKQLKGQNPHIEKGNTVVMTKLIAGEYDVAIVYLHQLMPRQQEGAPIEEAPFDRAYSLPSSAYVAKDAPHPNAARLLLRWWIGSGGQTVADKIRPSGNPAAGANTLTSRYLEQKGAKVSIAGFELQDSLPQLAKEYQQAIGQPVA